MTEANAIVAITSRENALIKELRKLGQDSTAYRKTGRIWIEGEHLCSAYMQRGHAAAMVLFSESFLKKNNAFIPVEYAQAATKMIVIADSVMAEITALESVAGMGMVCELPPTMQIEPQAPSVILDRLQDPGNVGSILRSAAAFGYQQVIALKGTAALYSPKVLRAGMGAHFGLRLIEGASPDNLHSLQLPLASTSSHQGEYLHHLLQRKELLAQYPKGFNWVLGHEGQGVSPALQALASLHVRIAQPGGEESLNAAAAAAICLHGSATFYNVRQV